MSGAIKRLPGEKFADFTARQRALQQQEKAEREAQRKSARALRRHKPDKEVSDFDYSMNH